MKKILISIMVMISLAVGCDSSVSARPIHHLSHRTIIARLYHHAYYELEHHHSYKRSFHKLYKTEYKYHYSYTYRPKVHHHWHHLFRIRFLE